MLSFEHVGKFVLSDISLHIPKGVAVGIIGASGAGKTTFLKLACGLLAPEDGKVYTMQKCPVEKREQLGTRIGCLLERMPVLDEYSTVADNFKNLQIIHQISTEKYAKEYASLAERLAIRTFENTPVKNLSFGQRRRAELAAVLLHHPELLLLDEPTNGLDENAKNSLQELLQERVKEGMTLVFSSHNMREVSGICQRIVLLEEGKLLYYGEEAALLRRYAPMDSMRVRFLGELPDFEDLPVAKYVLKEGEAELSYNSNYVTASDILEAIVKQTSVQEVSIQKPDLADVIFAMKEEKRGRNQ